MTTAFVADVLDVFARTGVLGGRRGIGHGRTTTEWTHTSHPAPAPEVDWRAALTEHRAEVLAAIATLT